MQMCVHSFPCLNCRCGHLTSPSPISTRTAAAIYSQGCPCSVAAPAVCESSQGKAGTPTGCQTPGNLQEGGTGGGNGDGTGEFCPPASVCLPVPSPPIVPMAPQSPPSLMPPTASQSLLPPPSAVILSSPPPKPSSSNGDTFDSPAPPGAQLPSPPPNTSTVNWYVRAVIVPQGRSGHRRALLVSAMANQTAAALQVELLQQPGVISATVVVISEVVLVSGECGLTPRRFHSICGALSLSPRSKVSASICYQWLHASILP